MTQTLNTIKIGIIGGGQLGQMMAMSAIEMGFDVVVLDPDSTCPASKVCSHFICAPYNDMVGLQRLNEMCDVITYEFENVPIKTLQENISLSKCPQGFKALEISQDRLLEKQFAQSLDIPTVDFFVINTIEDFNEINDKENTILKTRRLGYDGKGQIDMALESSIELNQDSGYILEKKCKFDSEISIAITRFKDGVSFFPVSQNVHKGGILRYSISPSNHSETLIKKAQDYTQRIVEALDYVGVFVVEYFVEGEKLYFNEFAPRPHNSYHASIEACEFSQFDTHIRAITRQSKVEPKLMSPTLMINILGDNFEKALKYQSQQKEKAHMHIYGKKELRIGRKMGHMTYCVDDPQACIEKWESELC